VSFLPRGVMPGCCNTSAYERVFDPRQARNAARQYREQGLDATAQRMVRFLTERSIEGQTILEIGGGVGAMQLELLKAGATSATNVELSAGYESTAQDLLDRAGLRHRVARHVFDFAQQPESIGPADVVILHRVICCYPDMEALVVAAAGRTRRYLALSFPSDPWWTRLAIRAENLWHQLTRTGFRAYLHPPWAILAIARSYGFAPVLQHRGWIWQTVVLERDG
jgi:2-polyprenyl-3-methyl-5-hydroxy-6-metoxy-1,4-benzoquinol methylase